VEDPDTSDYYHLLARIHRHLRPRTYLEIGVHEGHSLSLALPSTVTVGVDPAANASASLPEGARLIGLPSDEFFQSGLGQSAFGGRPIEMAFIDGLHLFEQALRDFIHVERHAHPDAVILIHDCLPIDKVTSSRERTTVVWSGDVWKVILCLRQYRPDLHVAVVDVPPTGIGVITNLNPSSAILPGQLDALYDEFVPMDYDDLVTAGGAAALNRVSSDWATVAELLPSRPYDRDGLPRASSTGGGPLRPST
jgi:hypothetical protein